MSEHSEKESWEVYIRSLLEISKAEVDWLKSKLFFRAVVIAILIGVIAMQAGVIFWLRIS